MGFAPVCVIHRDLQASIVKTTHDEYARKLTQIIPFSVDPPGAQSYDARVTKALKKGTFDDCQIPPGPWRGVPRLQWKQVALRPHGRAYHGVGGPAACACVRRQLRRGCGGGLGHRHCGGSRDRHAFGRFLPDFRPHRRDVGHPDRGSRAPRHRRGAAGGASLRGAFDPHVASERGRAGEVYPVAGDRRVYLRHRGGDRAGPGGQLLWRSLRRRGPYGKTPVLPGVGLFSQPPDHASGPYGHRDHGGLAAQMAGAGIAGRDRGCAYR